MTPDPITDLCAILRGEREMPFDQGDETLVGLARAHRVDRLVARRDPGATRRDVLLDEVSVRELCAVIDQLEAATLEPIVFKGAALAHTHYADSWMRPRLDADILIAPEHRERAAAILRARGYRQPPSIAGRLVSYQSMFVRTDAIGAEHVVDLHWHVANPQAVANVVTHRELAARAERIHVRGHTMRVPSAVDALLLACIHRAAHHGDADDLIWLYDIHLIASRLNAAQWTTFIDLATTRQTAAISARGLAMSVDRFHTNLPDDLIARLSPPSSQPSIESSAVFLRKDLRAVDRLIADLRMLGVRQGARLLREHLFPPAAYVKEKYGVRTKALVPALYAFRIVAGASKWLRRPDSAR